MSSPSSSRSRLNQDYTDKQLPSPYSSSSSLSSPQRPPRRPTNGSGNRPDHQVLQMQADAYGMQDMRQQRISPTSGQQQRQSPPRGSPPRDRQYLQQQQQQQQDKRNYYQQQMQQQHHQERALYPPTDRGYQQQQQQVPQQRMPPSNQVAFHPEVDMPVPYQQQQQQVIRKKTVRKVELFRGNLVLNCPIPDRLLAGLPFNGSEEVQTMRYSAVTCHPDDFIANNFTLRPVLYNRPTELAIVLTYYNEEPLLVARTLQSVFKNIAYLCQRDRSKVWGPEGWKKVVVCFVADGRQKIDPAVLEMLGVMGIWQDAIMKSEVNQKQVEAHLFEYTAQVCIDEEGKIRGHDKGLVPVQFLFCLKEKNKKKLNSHRWFFNAFCPLLQPNVCVLIDVGTKPTHTSIYHLWKAFDTDQNVGGACGEIAVDKGTACYKIANPLVAAQNFEYKLSNILDKPLESVFGYISVLPGAFSAYRYRALLNNPNGSGPLASYFEGEKLHDGSDKIFKANMYLAEDRILCFELVAKPKCSWVLKYVKSARAETDVPEGVPEFISQRRRWLNGSFFAATYALMHWWKIWNTGHSMAQKWLFQVQLVYNLINLVYTWFGIALFYLTFFYLSQNVVESNLFKIGDVPIGGYIFQAFRQLYIFAIVIIFISSLGNRPQGSKAIYIFCMCLFAIIMGMMLFLSGWTIAQTVSDNLNQITTANPGISAGSAFSKALTSSSAFRDIFITLVSTYGIYFLASLLHGDPWHMLTCFVQYMFLLPSFINILGVYAFCNTHDVSWGTKGDNTAPKLGSAKGEKAGGTTVELELPFENGEDKSSLNAVYEKWVFGLTHPKVEVEKKRDLATKLEDWYKNFRTRLVLLWIFTNAILIVLLTYPQIVDLMGGTNANHNPFLAFIFWSYLALSAIRFIGSSIYLFGHFNYRYGSCRC